MGMPFYRDTLLCVGVLRPASAFLSLDIRMIILTGADIMDHPLQIGLCGGEIGRSYIFTFICSFFFYISVWIIHGLINQHLRQGLFDHHSFLGAGGSSQTRENIFSRNKFT